MPATITSNKECVICGDNHTVLVPDELFNATMVGLSKWQSGEYLIQDALPFLNRDDREILISGVGAVCWQVMADAMEAEEE